MTTRSLKSTRMVLALMAAGLIGGASVTALQNMSAAQAAPAAVAAAAHPLANPSASVPMALPDFSEITAQYGPAVVNISVTGTTKTSNESPVARRGQQDDPFGNDPFFEFFRRFQQGQQGQQRVRVHRAKLRCTARVRDSLSVPTASSSQTRMWCVTPKSSPSS